MSEIIYETENQIATITLNRPEKRNALNDALVNSLKNALGEADKEENLRAIVIRGARKICWSFSP
jgi:enoyl-CoA hydratase/carnithine racemase